MLILAGVQPDTQLARDADENQGVVERHPRSIATCAPACLTSGLLATVCTPTNDCSTSRRTCHMQYCRQTGCCWRDAIVERRLRRQSGTQVVKVFDVAVAATGLKGRLLPRRRASTR